MRERPKELSLLALVLVVIAISVPVQVMWFTAGPTEILAIPSRLSFTNWVVMLAAVVNAVFVWRASVFVLATAPIFIASVAWNNAVSSQPGSLLTDPGVLLATLGVVVIHGALLTRNVRRVLLNPSLRWWRCHPRRRAALRATVCSTKGAEYQVQTFDVSEGGAFFVTHGFGLANPKASRCNMNHMPVGARVSVLLKLDQFHVLNCAAQVVRHGEGKGSYPTGFGVRFLNLSPDQKRILTGFLHPA